jgi:hypothetical protein
MYFASAVEPPEDNQRSLWDDRIQMVTAKASGASPNMRSQQPVVERNLISMKQESVFASEVDQPSGL